MPDSVAASLKQKEPSSSQYSFPVDPVQQIRIALNASPILTAKHEIRFSSRLLFSTYSKKSRHEFQIHALLSVSKRVLSLFLDRNTPRILVLVLDSFKFWKLHLLVPNRQETEGETCRPPSFEGQTAWRSDCRRQYSDFLSHFAFLLSL